MKMRLAAAATALGSAVVVTAIAGPSAFADTATPVPSPSAGTWSSPLPSPSGSAWSSPVASPSGVAWSPPVSSPSGSPVSGSPSGSPSSVTQLPPAAQGDNPVVGFQSMPTGPVVVGGAPVEFTVTYTNPSHQDLIAFPNLFIPNSAANPNGAAPLKLEVQDAQGVWHTAAQLGSGSSAPTTWAMVYPGPQGDPWDNSWLYVPAGDVASIHVRLTAGPTTPTGVTYAVSDFTGSLLDSSGTPVSVASGMWGATLNFAAATASPQAGGSPTSAGSTATTGPNGSNGSNAKPGSNPAVPASVLSKVTTPQAAAPAPAVIAAAKAASPAHPAGDLPAPSHSAGSSLAFTGGGSDSLPIALTGAAVIAAGVATLVVVRRRKGSHAA